MEVLKVWEGPFDYHSFIHLFTAYETVIMESGSISDFSVGFISVNDIILVY